MVTTNVPSNTGLYHAFNIQIESMVHNYTFSRALSWKQMLCVGYLTQLLKYLPTVHILLCTKHAHKHLEMAEVLTEILHGIHLRSIKHRTNITLVVE